MNNVIKHFINESSWIFCSAFLKSFVNLKKNDEKIVICPAAFNIHYRLQKKLHWTQFEMSPNENWTIQVKCNLHRWCFYKRVYVPGQYSICFWPNRLHGWWMGKRLGQELQPFGNVGRYGRIFKDQWSFFFWECNLLTNDLGKLSPVTEFSVVLHICKPQIAYKDIFEFCNQADHSRVVSIGRLPTSKIQNQNLRPLPYFCGKF